MSNLILNTDSYKMSHFLQYPYNTAYVNSYIASRGIEDTSIAGANPEIVNLGLQMFIMEYLEKPITMADIQEAEYIAQHHGLPFNKEGWMKILKKHGGFLPIYIEGLPEGTPVPVGTTQYQVRNTDPELPWVTSYIETALLRAIWYPSTVATISREIKKIIKNDLEITCMDPASVLPFRLHDFGARGVSSKESAGIGGLAHIVNFQGTDTIEAIQYAFNYYYARGMPAFSIPAAEHSTITSWGKSAEEAAYRNMLQKFGKPGALVAVVSDSYDIYNACEKIWGEKLRDEVQNSGATVVIRPDSGDPVTVVSKVIDILGAKFGYRENQKGYKVLNPAVRVIQGDGVNYFSISEILVKLLANGWSAENVAFGMGGALLQKVNRDTFKYAMKASAMKRLNDVYWNDVFKEPVTDTVKASKRGIQTDERFLPFYENGNTMNIISFDQVRANAEVK